MKYFKKIVGDRIYLSPINPLDAEQYVEWLNNIETAKYLGQYTKIHTVSGEEEWISNLPKNGEYNFAIVLKDDDKLLGNISLVNITKTNRTAE